MTARDLKALNALAGRCEALQCRLSVRKDRSDNDRRAYEAVAEAKSRLMDALNAGERA